MSTDPLNENQIEAIARIQKALGNMARLQDQINEAIGLHGLELNPLRVGHECGRLAHEIEGVLFRHDSAKRAADRALFVLQRDVEEGMVSL